MREFLFFASLLVLKKKFLVQAQYMREFLFFCLTFGVEIRILSTGSVYA